MGTESTERDEKPELADGVYPGASLKSASDKELMEHIGDEDDPYRDKAHDVMYDRYVDDIKQFVCGYTSDISLAEDIAQITFDRVYRLGSSYDPNYRFKTWLFQIAKNETRRHYKKEERNFGDEYSFSEVDYEDNYGNVLERQYEDDEIEIEDGAWDDLQAQQIREAMELIPPEQAEVIELRVHTGRTYSDLADMLGIPESTVTSRYRSGLRKLRRICGEGEEFKEELEEEEMLDVPIGELVENEDFERLTK